MQRILTTGIREIDINKFTECTANNDITNKPEFGQCLYGSTLIKKKNGSVQTGFILHKMIILKNFLIMGFHINYTNHQKSQKLIHLMIIKNLLKNIHMILVMVLKQHLILLTFRRIMMHFI